MPLFDGTHRGKAITYAHIPQDREKFWSGSVVVNLHDKPLPLSITLIGEQGTDLSHLLTIDQVTLSPYQKWVQYLTQGIFDDTSSAEKVAYVVIQAPEDILGFELYGLQDSLGAAATAGIMALPENQPTWWALRCALTQLDWVGASILNPTDRQSTVEMSVHNRSGSVLQQASYSHPGKTKMLGLLDSTGFVFPYRSASDPVISVSQPGEIGSVIIESDLPLRVFELSGDAANTVLDGSAVRGGQSFVMIQDPHGTLQIVNSDAAQQITVSPLDQDGNLTVAQNIIVNAAPWSLSEIDVTPWDAASIQIRGRNFAAFMIDRDSDSNALTILSPAQILGIPQ